MVRRIVFEDEVSWVARLRLPDLKDCSVDRKAQSVRQITKVEVATMRYLKYSAPAFALSSLTRVRSKTEIPVPEVYCYDSNPLNDVGAPFILMTYIEGTIASELRWSKEYDPGMFGTEDQDKNFRSQMANIQVELAAMKFDMIGSLYQIDDTPEFYIGPDLETGKGPWKNAMDYYHDVAQYAFDSCQEEASTRVKESDSVKLPKIFEGLIAMYGERTNQERFGLANIDFGAHNLLVDNDFNIDGLIDLEGMLTAPVEVVSLVPQMACIEMEIPGYTATRPAEIERIEEDKFRNSQYQGLLAQAEAELTDGEIRISEVMVSTASLIVQGLRDYMTHQKERNDNWMNYYNSLLERKENLIDMKDLQEENANCKE